MERSCFDPASLARRAARPFHVALVAAAVATLGTLASPARAADVPLGAVAVVALPEHGVAKPADTAELERIRDARRAPRLLFAGALSADGHSAVRYEFHRSGRYTEPGHDALDMSTLAERLTAEGDAWTFAGWRTPPVFDREHHVLFWAYDVKSPEGRRTLGFAAFLTREGVLLFQRTSDRLGAFDGEDAAFRGLLARVRVNDGRRWEDFVATDPIAAGSMADLVAERGVPREPGAPGASAPAAAREPARGRDLRETILDLLRHSQFRIGGLVAAVVGLRILFGVGRALARQRVKPEEVTLPPGATRKPGSPFDDNRPIN